jgi:seryl-tRNA synthetase
MLDIKFIRENPEAVIAASLAKKVDVDVKKIIKLDEAKRKVQTEMEALRAEQKKLSALIPKADAKEKAKLLKETGKLKEKIQKLGEKMTAAEEELLPLLLKVPNVPDADVPVGMDESGNKVAWSWGTPKKFAFKPKEHWELGETLDVIDNERAAKTSGARFTFVKGRLALLQFALLQHVMRIVTSEDTLKRIALGAKLEVSTKPFVPVIPPALIKSDVLQKMGRLEPRDERYHIPGDDLYLIGSAEHTLGSMHLDEVLDEHDVPRRYVGYSPAFRREAGSYGKDTRGMIRLHQFDKIELESFSLPEHSHAEQDFLVAIQEHIMQSLNLPYQVVMICTGDMGSPDARQIDIETWMPGQNTYRETHTADLMTDYQARRLNTRIRRKDGAHVYAHMNDATAIAMGRVMVAIMENYQEEDGSIGVPEALIPYCGFDKITK